MSDVLSGAVPATRPQFGLSLFAGIACLMDIVLLQGWIQGRLAMVEVIALHTGLVLGLGALAMLVRRQFSQPILVRVILLILFGPLGGPALMIAAPAALASRRDEVRAQSASAARTEAAPSADDIFDRIEQGRRHPLNGSPPRSLLKTLAAGSLHQQQEALAAISRAYHPDMRPALAAALASPTPALRVQAAAVYAKLRGTYEARAKELLALGKTGDLPADPALAAECLTVAASGFVDPETAGLLKDLSAQLADSSRSPDPSAARMPEAPVAWSGLKPLPRLKRHACGGLG